MKYHRLFLLVLVVLVSAIGVGAQDTAQHVLTFDQLKAYDGTTMVFTIDGYVFDIYKCPPCPKGAMCKPCIPDNIVITDSRDPKLSEPFPRLRILVEKPDLFELKGHYIFSVRVWDTQKEGKPVQEVKLESFQKFGEFTIDE